MTQEAQTLERPSVAAFESISDLHDEPAWLRERRKQAWSLYQGMAMPRLDEEDWRRTDLRGLKLEEFETFKPGQSVSSHDDLPAGLRESSAPGDFSGVSFQVDSTAAYRELSPELEKQGVVFCDLHTAAREHPGILQRYLMGEDGARPDSNKFSAMHAALFAGGNLLHVPKGVEIEKAIKCTYWIDDANIASFPHTLVVLDEGARVALIDEYISPTDEQPALAIPITEAHLGAFSQLNYVSLQRWGGNTWNMSRQRFVLGEQSNASLLFAALGAKTTKAYVETVFNGNASNAKLKGLILADGEQHVDYQTLQQHAGVASESDLDFKAALRGSAKAIWLGLCVIEKSGQRSNANQSCRNLLLSPNASAFPIPSLEILANDVKCSHGTTVGQVDEGQIFYAQTRGIDRQTAERMIVDGFFEPLIDAIPTEGVRDLLHEVLDQRLDL